MRICFYGALAALFLSFSGAQPALAETRVAAGAGVGDEESIAYEVSVQHNFAPWLEDKAWSLQPLAQLAGFIWANDDDTVGGGVLAAGLQLNFPGGESWRPYLAASFGGALLSDNRFDSRDFGCNFQFRTRGGLGVAFGQSLRHSLEAHFTHYSNCGLHDDNDGYNSTMLQYAFAF